MPNPLEHHTFRSLIESRTQIVSTDVGTFTLRSYYYSRIDYRFNRIVYGWWHLITSTDLSDSFRAVGSRKGLLNINGIKFCTSCLTSEFVECNPNFNGGTATCKCGALDNGWEG